MKMMALPNFRAVWKRSRTRLAPTPTNISIKSDPVTDKNGTPASPATALAIRVLPVPGGPTRSTPLGMRAPTAAKRSGAFRKSTTSVISCLTPLYPAMSSNPVSGRSVVYVLALLRPIDIIPLICPCALRCIHQKRPIIKTNGSRRGRMLRKGLELLARNSTSILRSRSSSRSDSGSSMGPLLV